MSLTPPKRLFHVPTMSTVMYDVVDVEKKGYVAISHVWGDQQMYSADELGIRGGVDWKIPLSNSNKISRLVGIMKKIGLEYCWFDILCMPQDKQSEINLEIPFMGDYYAGAVATFVLSDIEYTVSKEFIKWYSMSSDIVLKQRDPTEEEGNWMFSEFRNLLDFYKDPWFGRLWTFQETILSKRIIIIDINGGFLDFSDIITNASYLFSINSLYSTALFRSSQFIPGIGDVLKEYKEGTLDLVTVLCVGGYRDCREIHDKFYGVLGILGYKDFVVDYDIDIDELNKRMVRHSYSRGDASWMAVGGHDNMGFIQPMYKPFPIFGDFWKEDVPSIKFCDDLYIEAATVGIVTHCEKYIGPRKNLDRVTSQIVNTFRNWGLDYADMFSTMMGYPTVTKEFMQIWTLLLDGIFDGKSFMEINDKIIELGSEISHELLAFILKELMHISDVSTRLTMVKSDKYALLVTGSANVGDEIMVTRIRDINRRRLGIISSNSVRKGVCVLPYACEFSQGSSRKFLL